VSLNNLGDNAIVVTAPARLHFGLLELCRDESNLFGGIGLMIEQPSTSLAFSIRANGLCESDADDLRSIPDDVAMRIATVAASTGERLGFDPQRIKVSSIRRSGQHVGLGSGTQLACTVATGMAASTRPWATFFGEPPDADRTGAVPQLPARSIWEHALPQLVQDDRAAVDLLLQCAKRGARSHIGLFGFLNGGLIFDSGATKGHANLPSVSDERILEQHQVPSAWRVLLVTPKTIQPVHGQLEAELIRQCGQRGNENKERMLNLISDAIIPNLTSESFDMAGEAIYEYSVLAGELFRPVQGGVFRDQTTTFVVNKLRSLGVKAVGQSSWGPTVFGIVSAEEQADWIVHRWQASEDTAGLEIRVVQVNNTGASVRWIKTNQAYQTADSH
jgi:predicted sugar kinase